MTLCQYIADDKVRCVREATVGDYCEDHQPDTIERLRARIAEQRAKLTRANDASPVQAAPQQLGDLERAVVSEAERLAMLKQAASAHEKEIAKAKARGDQLRSENLELERTSRALKSQAADLRARIGELASSLKVAEQAALLPKPSLETLTKADALLARAVDSLLEPELGQEAFERAREARETAKEARLFFQFLERLGSPRPPERD